MWFNLVNNLWYSTDQSEDSRRLTRTCLCMPQAFILPYYHKVWASHLRENLGCSTVETSQSRDDIDSLFPLAATVLTLDSWNRVNTVESSHNFCSINSAAVQVVQNLE